MGVIADVEFSDDLTELGHADMLLSSHFQPGRIAAMTTMSDDAFGLHQNEEDVLRFEASDEELEAAAQATAMSYTHQTSAYNRCCR